MRLTREVRQRLLELNEGFTHQTHYEGNNSSESRQYEITGGELRVRANGNGAWGAANERYEREWTADEDETHRFLYNNLGLLNTDGLE